MTVEERVRKVLFETTLKDVEPAEINSKSILYEYGVGVDSVATLEMIVELEVEFQVRIDETEITPETFLTIENITNYIAPKL